MTSDLVGRVSSVSASQMIRQLAYTVLKETVVVCDKLSMELIFLSCLVTVTLEVFELLLHKRIIIFLKFS
jgi:hypothetical protein